MRTTKRFGLMGVGVLVTVVTASLIGPAPQAADRPPVSGRNAGVSAGHPLTTAAAFEVLTRGGNAFDAGVAALLVGGVVEQDLYSLGGEALVLVYPRSEGKVTSIVGQGWAPKAATIDWYTSRGKTLDGAGLDPAVIPGALHAALTVLEKWGTMSFEQVSARAVEYAGEGFPLRPLTAASIEGNLKFFQKWPDNQRYWLKPDGSTHKAGATIKLPALARTLTRMVDAERAAAKIGRAAGIAAARDRFYKGDIAVEMVAFLKKHQAPFELDDFSEYFAQDRRAGDDQLPRISGLQALVRQPGPRAARGAQHPRAVRPEGDEAQQRRLHPYRRRSAEAGVRRSRHLLRGSGFRQSAGRRPALENRTPRSAPLASTRKRRPGPSRLEIRCPTTRT